MRRIRQLHHIVARRTEEDVAHHPAGQDIVAAVDRALAGYDHPALHRVFHWDLTHAAEVVRSQVEEIADLAVYLAGATYTTGQVHVIDGGWTAQ